MYIDHINKATSWIDPRDSYERVRNEAEELPFGMTEEWDPRAGSYFMNNLTRRATKIDPRTGQEVGRNAHAQARSRIIPAEELMRGSTPRGTRRQVYPRDESPSPSHTSLGTYSMGNLSHDLDGHSTGTRSHNTSDDMATGGMSPVLALDDEAANLELAQQLHRDYKDQKFKIIEPQGQDVAMLAANCGITFALLDAGRVVEPVSAARKAKQGKWLAELQQYTQATIAVTKQLRTGLRAIEAGDFQGDIPQPPSLAQPIHKYVELLRQHVEDQQNDLHDLRALRTELPDVADGRSASAGGIVRQLQQQSPMAVSMLRSLMQRQDGQSSRSIDEDQKGQFFVEIITALQARIEYRTLAAQLDNSLVAIGRATKSSTPNLELRDIVGTSSF